MSRGKVFCKIIFFLIRLWLPNIFISYPYLDASIKTKIKQDYKPADLMHSLISKSDHSAGPPLELRFYRVKIFKIGKISFFLLFGPPLGKNRSQALVYVQNFKAEFELK